MTPRGSLRASFCWVVLSTSYSKIVALPCLPFPLRVSSIVPIEEAHTSLAKVGHGWLHDEILKRLGDVCKKLWNPSGEKLQGGWFESPGGPSTRLPCGTSWSHCARSAQLLMNLGRGVLPFVPLKGILPKWQPHLSSTCFKQWPQQIKQLVFPIRAAR